MTSIDPETIKTIETLAKAAPPKVWEVGVEKLGDLFAPATETMAGIGRVIRARFDRLVAVEQATLSLRIEAAVEKVRLSGLPRRMPNPALLTGIIDVVQQERDPTIGELWVNLLAQEMTGQDVHPELCRVLAELSRADAMTLSLISLRSPIPGFGDLKRDGLAELVLKGLEDAAQGKIVPSDISVWIRQHPRSSAIQIGDLPGILDYYQKYRVRAAALFPDNAPLQLALDAIPALLEADVQHVVLKRLNLIMQGVPYGWQMDVLGTRLIAAITPPIKAVSST